jgi:transcriptional regulator with XRE-family HTH domain
MSENALHKEYFERFGRHLKSLRISRKLSYRKFASKCNVEFADIARYEKGEINLTMNTLIELSLGLEIPLKELMDF